MFKIINKFNNRLMFLLLMMLFGISSYTISYASFDFQDDSGSRNLIGDDDDLDGKNDGDDGDDCRDYDDADDFGACTEKQLNKFDKNGQPKFITLCKETNCPGYEVIEDCKKFKKLAKFLSKGWSEELCSPSTECGNGVVDAGEQCDTSGEQTATCEENCTTPVCGDNILNTIAGEQCDSGGEQSATCEENCTTPVCGDNIFNTLAGEQCDSGGEQTTTCEENCTTPVCGDSILNTLAGEQCDDGNLDNGDGCDSQCIFEQTTCVPVPEIGEACFDGIDNDCDGTLDGDEEACQVSGPVCGDGEVNQPSEECDDGNKNEDDFCNNSCITTEIYLCENAYLLGVELAGDGLRCDVMYFGSKFPWDIPGDQIPENEPDDISRCKVRILQYLCGVTE